MNQKSELIKTLREVKKYLLVSEDSAWSSKTPEEVIYIFDESIVLLEEDKNINKSELELLFAPTGNIQEIALDNNWGNEYLDLSLEFDRNIKNI